MKPADRKPNLANSQNKESERQWKNQEIADQYSDYEHRITSADYPHDVFPLIGIQSQRYEPEQLVEDVGRRTKHTGTQCRLHVDDELLRQSRVDE